MLEGLTSMKGRVVCSWGGRLPGLTGVTDAVCGGNCLTDKSGGVSAARPIELVPVFLLLWFNISTRAIGVDGKVSINWGTPICGFCEMRAFGFRSSSNEREAMRILSITGGINLIGCVVFPEN